MSHCYWKFKFCNVLFFITVFFIPSIKAQRNNLDSLQKFLVNAKNDTNKVNLLNKIGSIYADDINFEQSIKYHANAKRLAESINFQKGVAHSLYNIGYTYRLEGNYSEALVCFFQSLKIIKQSKNSFIIAKTELIIGSVFYDQGYYFDALKYTYQALSIAEKNSYHTLTSACLNNIGLIYTNQKNYVKALECFNKSLDIKIRTNDSLTLVTTYNNIANIYLEQHNYFKAYTNYLKILDVAKKNQNDDAISYAYLNIGIVHQQQQNNSLAIQYLQQALKIFQEMANKQGIAVTCIKLSNSYYAQHKIQEAQLQVNKGLHLAYETGSLEDIVDAHKMLSKLDSSLKKYDSALIHYQKYIMYRDSLQDEENTNNIAQAHMKYEFDKKLLTDSIRFVADTKVAQAQLKQEKTYRYALYFGLALVLIFAIFIYNRFRVTKQQQLIINEQGKKEILVLEQKLLRSQMNPHFIFNAVNIIDGFIFKNKNAEASLYLKRFAGFTRQVLEYSEKEYISLSEEINVLENYIELQKIMFDNNFNYQIKVDDSIDQTETQIPPMLAQPFVENAIKYGVSTNKNPGFILIHFAKKNEVITLTIEDDGPGLREKSPDNNHKSMATNIVKRRLANYANNNVVNVFIKNKIDNFDNIIGTIVSIDVPYIIDE